MCGRDDDPSQHDDIRLFGLTLPDIEKAVAVADSYHPLWRVDESVPEIERLRLENAALKEALKTALKEKHEAEEREREVRRMFSETA